jgi:hypothetical protein
MSQSVHHMLRLSITFDWRTDEARFCVSRSRLARTTVAADEDVTVDGVAVTDDVSVDLAGGRYICSFYRCVVRICLLENEG